VSDELETIWKEAVIA